MLKAVEGKCLYFEKDNEKLRIFGVRYETGWGGGGIKPNPRN